MSRRRPLVGYAAALTAVTLWSLNASVSRTLLDGGLSASRLAELRTAGTFALLLVAIVVIRPRLLRVPIGEIRPLVALGVFGIGLLYVSYSLAVERIKIGVALTIEYLAPALILIWLAVARRRKLPGDLVAAIVLALVGCAAMVGSYGSLDGIGVAAALAAAFGYAFYLLTAERLSGRYHPATTLVWAFGAGTLVLFAVQPPHSFPFERLDGSADVALAVEVIVVGTLLPFALMLLAVRHVTAIRIAVVGASEPALSALFAFLIHDEGLSAVQVLGGLLLLGAVVWVQLQRPNLPAELAAAGAEPSRQPARP
ncbi:MAG TPA: EamA family transporter [Thermoleophilaceae bacterium]|nr:EamA family transporter [Thermoleophilaceae bacterium]